MRRLNKEGRLKSIRLSQNRERKRLKRLRKRIRYVGGVPILANRITVIIPNHLSIFDNRMNRELSRVSSIVRKSLSTSNRVRVRLDFSDVEHFTVAALLKLHADIHVYEALAGVSRFVDFKGPKKLNLRKTMKELGFLRRERLHSDSMPGIISITSDTRGDRFKRDLFADMNQAFYGGALQKDGQEWDNLQGAIGEAMLNVVDHAYTRYESEMVKEKIGPRWWLVSQTLGDQLYIALVDKGIGIPTTIFETQKDKRAIEVLKRYFNMVQTRGVGPDSASIVTAIKYGQSRLKKRFGGRGTGLETVRKLVLDNPNGTLTIISNCGKYIFSYRSGEVTSEYDNSINGTLIQWNISLAPNPNNV